MSSATKHLQRAKAHLDALHHMRSEIDLYSWGAVVALYVARDLAHAVFDADPTLTDQVFKHPENHTSQDHFNPGTNYVIKRHYRSIELPYLDLYGVSKGVRYEGQTVAVEKFDEQMGALGEVAAWAVRELTGAARQVPTWLGELAQTDSPVPDGAA